MPFEFPTLNKWYLFAFIVALVTENGRQTFWTEFESFYGVFIIEPSENKNTFKQSIPINVTLSIVKVLYLDALIPYS